MAVVVIGGHSRNIGKTSVMCALISALLEWRWTAVKITQYGHGVCSANGEPCDCETGDHTIAISEERNATTGTDSARYLAAGAARSFWMRTRQGQLADAMPRLRKIMADAENVILESNSVLRFLQPNVYAAVLDPQILDFKPSALRYLDRADAIVLTTQSADAKFPWPGVSASLIQHLPIFRVSPPGYSSSDLASFVAHKLKQAEGQSLPPVEMQRP